MGMLGILGTAVAVFAIVQYFYNASLPQRERPRPEAVLGEQLAALHHALEDYASERGGQYPQDIRAVLDNDAYFELPPQNPYSDGPLAMLPPDSSEVVPGTFSYLPHVEETSSGLRVTEYVLVGYGDKPSVSPPALPDYAVLPVEAAKYVVVSYMSSSAAQTAER